MRFRRLTPVPAAQMVAFAVVMAIGLLLILSIVITNPLTGRSSGTASIWVLAGLFAACLYSAQRGIFASQTSLSISRGFSAKQIRFELIQSFEWKHNLENLGRPGKRLWITLLDGQTCPTPVITGPTLWTKPDIPVTGEQADALIRELEARRRAVALAG
jgi:hypothetical protein